MKTHNLLLVDDHPITIDAYINILSKLENATTTKHFTTAFSCKEAYIKIIEKSQSNQTFDFAFLDISLPPFEQKNIENGIDIGVLIRHYFPNCKIILVTMHNEPLLLYNSIQKINPEGFLYKNDVNTQSLITSYQYIMLGQKHYSTTIQTAYNQTMLKALGFDAVDCEILQSLARSILTKDMTARLELSLSAIEKRKLNIKNQLLRGKGSDKELILAAKNKGLL